MSTYLSLIFLSIIGLVHAQEISTADGQEIAYFHDMDESGFVIVTTPLAASGDIASGNWEVLRFDNQANLVWKKDIKIDIPFDETTSELDRFDIISSTDGKNLYLLKTGTDLLEVVSIPEDGQIKSIDLMSNFPINRMYTKGAIFEEGKFIMVTESVSNPNVIYASEYDQSLKHQSTREIVLPTNKKVISTSFSSHLTFLGLNDGKYCFVDIQEKRKEIVMNLISVDQNNVVESTIVTKPGNSVSLPTEHIHFEKDTLYYSRYGEKSFWLYIVEMDGEEKVFLEQDNSNIKSATQKYYNPEGEMSVSKDDQLSVAIIHPKKREVCAIQVDTNNGSIKSELIDMPISSEKLQTGKSVISGAILKGNTILSSKISGISTGKKSRASIFLYNSNNSIFLISKQLGDNRILVEML